MIKYLWEAYKVSENDVVKELVDRDVYVKDLVGTKLNRKNKRITDLIQKQQIDDKKD